MRSEELDVLANDRLVSPSAERNKAAISEVLRQVLPERGLVLEVGSGTGQHVVQFARTMPNLTWQPSERDVDCRRSILAWLATEKLANVLTPLHLDVSESPWPIHASDALVCINMIHIAPWSATEALFRGGGALLSGGGIVCLYGPFRRVGQHTAPSNEAFDALLRRQSQDWGVRDLEAVAGFADRAGFDLLEGHEMPSDNLTVVFRRRN